MKPKEDVLGIVTLGIFKEMKLQPRNSELGVLKVASKTGKLLSFVFSGMFSYFLILFRFLSFISLQYKETKRLEFKLDYWNILKFIDFKWKILFQNIVDDLHE